MDSTDGLSDRPVRCIIELMHKPDAGVGTPRFALEGRLGEGSGGVVYRARDGSTGASVALKTLRAVTPEQIALLKNEFRAVQDLHHPNLVQIGELVEEGGSWSLSMEYVDGVDFLTYVRASSDGFDEVRLRASLGQLASALRALHRVHTVHRDIKPSNVLVTEGGRVVVLDFGVALRHAASPQASDGITGTALYMAPEQAASEAVGPEADWYAVGVMLFRALTGRCPFEGLPGTVLRLKTSQPAPSPREFVSELPHDLCVLCERLLRMEPSERGGAADITRCLGQSPSLEPPPPTDAALVGRQRELDWLDAAFRASQQGQPVAAVLYGESGVGKSLLARTSAARLEEAHPGLLALFSRCYERSSVPFKALDGAADALVRVLSELDGDELAPLLSEHAGLLPRLFPEFGLVPALAELAETVVVDDPKEARRRGFEALRRLFGGLTNRQPVVLVIDDLQWVDTDSIVLLRALLEPPAAPPLFLLCTLRAGSETFARGRDVIGRLGRDVRSLSLGKLSPAEAECFVAELVAQQGAEPLDQSELDAILREAGGHPMYLVELVHQRRSDEPRSSHGRLDDALRARVRRLPPASLRMLEAVCVADLPIARRVAAEAASLYDAELIGALPQLGAERLVQAWQSDGDVVVEPYHNRVREAVVASLSDEQRRSWHGKLALALEHADAPAEPEVLAVHWRECGDAQRALGYVLRAAEKARASLAFDRAARLVAEALELCTDAAQRPGLRIALAEALTEAGRGPEAAQACLAATEGVPATDALELRRRASEQFLISGHLEEGLRTLNEVLRHFGLRLAPTTLQAVLTLLFLRLWTRVRGLRLRRRKFEEIPAAELQRVDACWSTSTGLSIVDNVRAAEFSARLLLLSLRAGDPLRYYRALLVESCFQGAQGASAHARKMLALVRPAAETGADPYLRAFYELASGWQAYFNGEFRVALTRCQGSLDLLEEHAVGARWERDMGAYWALCSAVFLGNLQGLGERLSRHRRDAEDRGDLFFQTLLRVGHTAVHWLAVDDARGAKASVDELIPRWPAERFLIQHMYALWSQTMIDLYEGGGEASVVLHERDFGAMKRGMHLRVQLSKLRALQMRASAYLGAAEHRADASEYLAKARADAQGILRGAPWARGWGLLLLAAVSHRERCPDEARTLLKEALYTLERAELGLHASAARVRLGELTSGAEAQALRAQGIAELTRQGVEAPEKFLRVLAPGFAAVAAGS